ncbi:hypothetical protein ACLOB2_03745 [Levilactobacillus brevis]|uniref:Uncharacterized protein n=3 Tax=Levilactobacillus brevis TaxID=1580 RepID=A0A5B7Y2T5_LEVBR|nr:hypothetical protein [Levilactobacillus brevis]KIO94121.1 hypothetical protein N624_0235 [Levilactobacillus brevis]KIP00792.1 hypothetical protein N627_1210 [Levilactobacillus brevis]MBX6948770.1 hypothetical protein [Levilactobacillus brevis]MCM6800967.1 hypothetical protein [Levilactobacillus brevis]MCM6806450.1 hypothetical protein [Levilactobacillus brevis]
MDQMIVDHAIIKQSGSDIDITIMDSTIAGAYDSALNDRPFSENRNYSGKTHIKFHGALKKGNMDIYIGKDMLTLMHAGLGAKGLVMIIVKAAGDDYIGAAKSLASAIQQTVKAGNVKTSVHFTIRHWTSIKKS